MNWQYFDVNARVSRPGHLLSMMALTCVVCSKVLKEAYRVRDKFGKPTQLGSVIEDLLEDDPCEDITRTVYRKCRYELLHLGKLKREYKELKGNPKDQLWAQRGSQQLRTRQVICCRSQSSESTRQHLCRCFPESLQDKTSAEKQYLENQ